MAGDALSPVVTTCTSPPSKAGKTEAQPPTIAGKAQVAPRRAASHQVAPRSTQPAASPSKSARATSGFPSLPANVTGLGRLPHRLEGFRYWPGPRRPGWARRPCPGVPGSPRPGPARAGSGSAVGRERSAPCRQPSIWRVLIHAAPYGPAELGRQPHCRSDIPSSGIVPGHHREPFSRPSSLHRWQEATPAGAAPCHRDPGNAQRTRSAGPREPGPMPQHRSPLLQPLGPWRSGEQGLADPAEHAPGRHLIRATRRAWAARPWARRRLGSARSMRWPLARPDQSSDSPAGLNIQGQSHHSMPDRHRPRTSTPRTPRRAIWK